MGSVKFKILKYNRTQNGAHGHYLENLCTKFQGSGLRKQQRDAQKLYNLLLI